MLTVLAVIGCVLLAAIIYDFSRVIELLNGQNRLTAAALVQLELLHEKLDDAARNHAPQAAGDLHALAAHFVSRRKRASDVEAEYRHQESNKIINHLDEYRHKLEREGLPNKSE